MLLNHPQENQLVTESTEISPFPAGYSLLVISKKCCFFAFYVILLNKYGMNLLCHGRKTHDLQSIMLMSSLCHSAPFSAITTSTVDHVSNKLKEKCK